MLIIYAILTYVVILKIYAFSTAGAEDLRGKIRNKNRGPKYQTCFYR
jgi:hypothetical protein